MIERHFQLFQGLLALLKGEVGLHSLLLIHEKSREDLVHVDSRNVVVIVIVDHIDEAERVCVESEMANPLLEVVMFIFDFLDETGEEVLHFLLHHEHLGDLRVRVLADDVLQLAPEHLLAFVVEQRAFALGLETVLTDESRLAALGGDADHVALVAVYALGTALQRLAHTTNQYKLLFNFTRKMGHQPQAHAPLPLPFNAA